MPKSSKKEEATVAKTVEHFSFVLNAVTNFITEYKIIESGKFCKKCLEKTDKCKTWNEVFEVPIKEKLFDYNTSLEWFHYITICAKNENIIESNPEFPREFILTEALDFISSVFDEKVEDLEEMVNEADTRSQSSASH